MAPNRYLGNLPTAEPPASASSPHLRDCVFSVASFSLVLSHQSINNAVMNNIIHTVVQSILNHYISTRLVKPHFIRWHVQCQGVRDLLCPFPVALWD